MDRWVDSENFWLARVAMLHQLSYKEGTDTERLFRYALKLSASREFFIRKAIVWALWQYSYTDPEAVQRFVAEHELSGLTRREALKAIKRSS